VYGDEALTGMLLLIPGLVSSSETSTHSSSKLSKWAYSISSSLSYQIPPFPSLYTSSSASLPLADLAAALERACMTFFTLSSTLPPPMNCIRAISFANEGGAVAFCFASCLIALPLDLCNLVGEGMECGTWLYLDFFDRRIDNERKRRKGPDFLVDADTSAAA